MTNNLNPALKALTTVMAIACLFLSCKKEELTVNQLGEMAEARLAEIRTLSSGIPCGQQDNVSIAEISTGCSASYYPVRSSDMERFGKLKKEYFDLLGRQTDAMVKQGIIIDPCYEYIWMTVQPIRLECKAGQVELITSENISIEDAEPLATQTYGEIMTAVNAMTCSSVSDWTYAALIKEQLMDVQYIPFPRIQAYAALKAKIALYNRLKLRILEARGPVEYVRTEQKVDRVDCVNGKPVLIFSKN